jgi:hypothetical protein
MKLGLDAGILAKDAMRHFGKLRTVRLLRVPERFFWESFGKSFWRNCFWENFGEVDYR